MVLMFSVSNFCPYFLRLRKPTNPLEGHGNAVFQTKLKEAQGMKLGPSTVTSTVDAPVA